MSLDELEEGIYGCATLLPAKSPEKELAQPLVGLELPAFNQRDHLRLHKASHAREKPSRRRVCRRSDIQPDRLSRCKAIGQLDNVVDGDNQREDGHVNDALAGPSDDCEGMGQLAPNTPSSSEAMTCDLSDHESESFSSFSTLMIDHPPNNIVNDLYGIFGGRTKHASRPRTTSSLPEVHAIAHALPHNIPQIPAVGIERPLLMAFDSTADIMSILRIVDLGRLISKYDKHSLPNMPCLHLPTLDLESAIRSIKRLACSREDAFLSDFLKGRLPPTSGIRRRPVTRSLLLSILGLGAGHDLQHDLARRIFGETGKAIRKFLETYRQPWYSTPPPLQLIQSMIHYIEFGLCTGDRVMEELALGHICSLASLVTAAGLAKGPRPSSKISLSRKNMSRLGPGMAVDQLDWEAWIVVEERQRTYFCAYLVCSVILTCFNPPVPFMDSRHIELCVPCREEIWEAQSARIWRQRSAGGFGDPSFQASLAQLIGLSHENDRYTTVSQKPGGTDLDDDNTFEQLSHSRPWQDHHPKRQPFMSEFGCLIMILVLHMKIWEWKQNHDINLGEISKANSTPYIFVRALENWRDLWDSFPRRPGARSVAEDLLVSCLPIVDHAQLLLQVNITEAKDALYSRDYPGASEAFAKLFLDKDKGNSWLPSNPLSPSISPSCLSSGSGYEVGIGKANRKTVIYAAHALELSFQSGPWWTAWEEAVDVPVVAAVTIFHCAQIVAGWLINVAGEFSSSSGNPQGQPSDLKLVNMIHGLVTDLSLALRKGDRVRSTTESENEYLNLAVDLLLLHAEVFERVVAWPILYHLAEGLRVTAARSVQAETRIREKPATPERPTSPPSIGELFDEMLSPREPIS